jgi:hypothetical protein
MRLVNRWYKSETAMLIAAHEVKNKKIESLIKEIGDKDLSPWRWYAFVQRRTINPGKYYPTYTKYLLKRVVLATPEMADWVNVTLEKSLIPLGDR